MVHDFSHPSQGVGDKKPHPPEGAPLHGAQLLGELPRLIERMHRRFLDVLRLEMERLGVRDISPVQVMMMSNIGSEEIAVRDLIERGYYLGSNASYNLKQLVDCGYVGRSAGERDRRSARLKVTPKGRNVLDKLAQLQQRWAEPLVQTQGDGAEGAIDTTWRTLRRLERCWSDTIRFAQLPDDDSF